MKLSPDDPRLTAYALGELEPRESAAIAAELRQLPALAGDLAEIERAAEWLSHELSAEPCPHLEPAQLAAIQRQLEPANIIHLPRRNWWKTAVNTALAASIMATLAWHFWFATSKQKPAEQMAQLEPAKISQPALPVADNVKTERPEALRVHSSVAPVEKSKSQPRPSADALAMSPATTVAPIPQPQVVSTPPSVPFAPVAIVSSRGRTDEAAKQLPERRSVILLSESQAKATTLAGVADASSPGQPARLLNRSQTPLAENVPASQFADASVNQSAQPWNPGAANNSDKKAPASDARFFRKLHEQAGSEYGASSERDRSESYVFKRHYIFPNPPNTATYPQYKENSFASAWEHPLSTFSVDVDTASYANVRRFLNANQMPPTDAVRVEEMINYFHYAYPNPHGEDPFAASIEVAGCPWNEDHRLVRIGLKARDLARHDRPAGNFVFLIDVSGSMEPAERLPLIKQALRALVKRMNADDRVAIVVYASEAGVRLESTSCSQKEKILEAIDSLEAGGSTNGGDGIQQAYRVAREHFINGGVNRVLLCTDGDFNVGITDQKELVRMIEEKAKSGVFLTTLGVGTDNYKDALMQKLADKGNGNYFYLDTLEEAQKVLLEQMNGTLVTVAQDVKIQVEFNPAQVGEYRLIGYEKRRLRAQDFNNDAKDAGEIGAGHTVTALYEIAPSGGEFHGAVDELKYQPSDAPPRGRADGGSKELLTLKVRYQQPGGGRSRLLEFPVTDGGASFRHASVDFKFAAAVAGFGMLLTDSENKGNATYGAMLELAEQAKGNDEAGYRSELINLVKKAEALQR